MKVCSYFTVICKVAKHLIYHICNSVTERYVLKNINSLIMLGIRNNLLPSGRRLLFYLFTRMAIKLIVVIV
jgi:hypothetical protein